MLKPYNSTLSFLDTSCLTNNQSNISEILPINGISTHLIPNNLCENTSSPLVSSQNTLSLTTKNVFLLPNLPLENPIKSKQPLFCKILEKEYLLPENTVFSNELKDENIALLLNLDTEYTQKPLIDIKEDSSHSPRLHVTTQFKHVHYDHSHIFVGKEFARQNEYRKELIRHPVIQHDCHLIDYLLAEGINAKIRRDTNAHHRDKEKKLIKYTLPLLQIVLYAHYISVDLTIIFENEYREDLRLAFKNKDLKMTRRLIAGKRNQYYWHAPWIITLNDKDYRVGITLHDSKAVHGAISYESFCENTGVILTVKKEISPYIKRMDEAYFEVPELYDQYATEDLKVYDALSKNAENTKKIYDEMGLSDHFQVPKLTSGATVKQLFEANLCNWIKLKVNKSNDKSNNKANDKVLENLVKQASASHLSQYNQNNSLAYTLAKCDGGRCRNANPLNTNWSEKNSNYLPFLVDLDISGAYASAMQKLDYPIGNPVIFSFKNVLFKNFYKKNNKHLIKRLWFARISTTQNLNYDQHLIPSWFDYRKNNIKRINQITNESNIITDFDINSGDNKIFTNQISLGIITSDILDIINKQWSLRQKKDFFKKIEINAIGFYPKSLRVETPQEVIDKQNSPIKQDFSLNLNGAHFENSNDTHVWTSKNIGELLINIMTLKRKEYPKKTPANELYKLYSNTLYGNSVSQHFDTSNMIVGNNITAMCRAMMYLTEIGLQLTGSITDGHIFDVNKVCYKKENKYLNFDHMARLYNKTNVSDKNICELKPLFNQGITYINNCIHIENNLYSEQQELVVKDIIQKKCLNHLTNLFSNVDLLTEKIFSFEIKMFGKNVATHGSANYLISNLLSPTDSPIIKIRSYETRKNKDGTLHKEHLAYTYNQITDAIEYNEKTYLNNSPGEILLLEIQKNPSAVKRLPPFIKTTIINPNDFSNRWDSTFKNSALIPGDTGYKIGLSNYFSISQFTFCNLDQRKSWVKEIYKRKNKFGESLEIFFSNNDDTINYQQMVIEVDQAICDGVMNPLKHFDKSRHLYRKILSITCDHFKAFQIMQHRIKDKMICDDNVYDEIKDDENW